MLLRSVTLNFAGSVLSLAVGFVGSILLARWLGPTDRGLLALLQSVSNVALTLTAFGLPMAVLYYASLPEQSSRRILGTTLVWGGLLAVVLVPGAWIFHDVIASTFGRGQGGLVWVLAAALIPLTFVDWTTHNQLLARKRFGLFNVLSVSGKVASLAVIVLLVGVLGTGPAGGLVALAATSLVMVAGSLPVVLRGGVPRFDRGLLRTMMHYGAKVQVGTIFSTLNYRLDVLVLQFFRPLEQVGIYVVAQVIAELVIVLAQSFQSSIIPLVASAEGDTRERTTILAVRHHSILAAGGCVLNAGFGTLLIMVAYGREYWAAIPPMLIILPGIWFLGTGHVVTSNLRGRGRPGTASTVSAAALVVTIALDFSLIPPFGVTGAAIGSLCAYVAYGTIALRTLSRIVGVPLRTLVVPTRADLDAYPAAARAVVRRFRPRRPATVEP